MSALRTGDAAPQMLVLGLVVRQSDTVAGIGRRLADDFRVAGFPRGSAHSNLPSLAEKGYVRLAAHGPPGRPTLNRYEATPAGREHFLEWLRCSEAPVLVRDVLQCKLELVEREDLASLVRFVHMLEAMFTDMCDTARVRVLKEQRSRRARAGQLGGASQPPDWRQKLRGIQNKDEANLWGLMAQRLELLGEDLEELLAEIAPEQAAR
jgi:DNA-binding PadR family transcriptional regulator